MERIGTFDPDLDHEEHERMEKHVVTGRISAPPEASPSDLLAQLDQALGKRETCKIYSRGLCKAAGQVDRAKFEERRFTMLSNNG